MKQAYGLGHADVAVVNEVGYLTEIRLNLVYIVEGVVAEGFGAEFGPGDGAG